MPKEKAISRNIPLVSIVIPVYNGSNYLAQAIDSALAQTYKNIEIIVINDGSNDNGATEKIAKSYGNKIRYYKKDNGGVATALNLGVQKMTGEYFSWLSHDDVYEADKIIKQVKKAESLNPHKTIIASNSSQLFGNGNRKKLKINRKAFDYVDIFLATSSKVGLNGCSLLIPVEILRGCGGFNEKLHYTQDYDMWFRLSSRVEFILLEDNLVTQRMHDGQGSVIMLTDLKRDADQMHSEFMNTIDEKRLIKFFKDKQNIKFYLKNYSNYKRAGYHKTSLSMIRSLLTYYKNNNSAKFESLLLKEWKYITRALDEGIKNLNEFQSIINTNHASSENLNKLYFFLRKVNLAELSYSYKDQQIEQHGLNKSTLLLRRALDLGPRLVLLSIFKKIKDSIKK